MNGVRKIALVALTLAGAGCAVLAPDPDIKAPIARTHDLLDRLVAAGELPGGAHLVIGPEGVRHRWTGGVADAATGAPMSPDTMFMINSTTKVVTAIALLQLVEAGVVSLDDPVRRWLPAVPYGRSLRVRHLLDHTGGIDDPLPTRWLHRQADWGRHDEAGALGAAVRGASTLASAPGEEYRYSNIGYWLLGEIVGAASGLDYGVYVERRVIGPLGIDPRDMTFDPPEARRMAVGHQRQLSLFTATLWFLSDGEIWGQAAEGWSRFVPLRHDGRAYGGLYATAGALARIAQDLLQPQPILLTAKSRARMFASRPESGDASGPPLGWRRGVTDGVGWLSKTGGGPGFSSNLRIYPALGVATVLLQNITDVSAGSIEARTDLVDGPVLKGLRRAPR